MDTVTHPDYLHQVAEFHQSFQHPVLTAPAIPSEDRCNLRTKLIHEELHELIDAIRDKDLVSVADALCDIQYVLSGTVLEFGLKDKFPALFAEVHRSNMSKACATEREACDTCLSYSEQGEECYYQQRNGLWFVYRKSDGKTMKSVNYSPADLFGVLHEDAKND